MPSLRPRLVVSLGILAAVTVGVVLVQRTNTVPGPPTAVPPSAPPAAPTVPPAVQAYADRVAPSFGGIVRLDRKAIVRVNGVIDRSVAIPGATSGTWAVVVTGDIRPMWRGSNSECAIFFVTYLGEVFASQQSTLRTCETYFAAAPPR